MKTAIAGMFSVIFLASCLIYLYGLSSGAYGLFFLRILIWANIFLFMSFTIIYDNIGVDTVLQEIFISASKCGLLALSLVTVLINALILKSHQYYAITIFISGTLLATCILVLSAARNGYFKSKYENE